MPAGKSGSQASHACLESFLTADQLRQMDYRKDGLGTKICLSVPDLPRLDHIFRLACSRGLPCARIEDTGRNTCFHGIPTITALGIGPIFPGELPELRRLRLHP